MRRGTALLATLGALAFSSSAQAADYVGLGDSYSSGNGTASSYSDNCDRTDLSYPALIDPQLPGTGVNLSCSGATTSNITADSQTPGNAQAQMLIPGGLGADTDYVTLEIGGNDVGFSSVLTECGNPFGNCDAAVAGAEAKARNELPAKLDATYAAVRNRAPNALIVVVGYPRIFRPNQSCNTFFSAQEVNELNAGADLLSEIIEDRAHAAAFAYVDARPIFTGHGACDSDEWINGLTFSPSANAYHPKAVGHERGYKPIVLAGIQNVPHTTITSTPPSVTNSTSATFGLSSNIQGSTFQCKLDNGAYTSCGEPKQYTGLSQGSHSFRARAVNPNGDVDQFPPAAYQWTVDTTAPPVTLDPSGPTGDVNTTSASFGFSTSDGTASLSCKLDGGNFAPCNSPASYTGLADGQHTFTVRATDPAGNSASASRTWTIDTAPPVATINSGPGNPTPSTTASFGFVLDDPDATAQCSLDGGAYAPCTSPQGYNGLADGQHTFSVKGTDALGNVGAPDTFSWTVDTVAPVAAIQSGPSDRVSSTSAEFSFDSTDPTASLQCRLDSGAFADCDSPKSYSGLSEGLHTFQVRAIDAAGNTGQVASRSWTVDTTPPPVAITSHPDNSKPTNSTTAQFGFSSETGATFRCRLDSDEPSAFVPCGSTQPPSTSYQSLADGPHTFDVIATDLAGNSSAPVSFSWTVDTTPPSVTLNTTPAARSNTGSAVFTFSSEAGASFQCGLDGGTSVSCSSPKAYDLGDGGHSFAVSATDQAGNTGPATTYFWTIDTQAPTVTFDSGPPDGSTSNATDAAFSFHASEEASRECRLAGPGIVNPQFGECDHEDRPDPTNGTFTSSGLADGTYTLTVRAKDLSEHTSAPVSRTWTVDTTPPTVTIDPDTGPNGATNQSSATFSFSRNDPTATLTCKLDSGSAVPCSSSKSYSGLTDGQHTFVVSGTDPAGNTGSAERTWTVDTAPPQTSIASGPSGSTTSTDAEIRFSSSENGSTFQCSLDGSLFASCTSPKSYSGLGLGDHTFRVRATDSAGNVDPSPAVVQWRIEVPAPSPPPGDSAGGGGSGGSSGVAGQTGSSPKPAKCKKKKHRGAAPKAKKCSKRGK